jgi:molybdopterin converting factor small subunit
MQVTILFFGRLTDITGSKILTMQDVEDTDALVKKLQQQYPAFQHAPYIVAVNKEVINGNTKLSNDCAVALLPPYSGG